MTQVTRRLGPGAIDGVVALAIVAFGFLPGSHLHHTLKELLSVRLTLVDTTFGLSFIYLWRYCFSLLKLYDQLLTASRRILATLQGVTLMIVPAVLYYHGWHPHILTRRSVILTFLGLYCYEINRAVLHAHLLDNVAARDPRRAVIIGTGRRASKAWRAVRTRYRHSLRLIGFVDDRHPDDMPPDVARRYLGSIDDLDSLVIREVVDLILIAMPIRSCYMQMQKAVHIAENAGVQVLYLDDIYSSGKHREDPTHSIFRELSPDQDEYLLFSATKRMLDIVGATLGLLALAPLFVIIATAIKITSEGSIFLQQERYGHRRRCFTMLTFRTTADDTEESLSHLEHVDQADGTLSNSEMGLRALPLGRILRSTSLDKLPKLWNVLIGNMSLVGPRPMSIHDVSLFDKASLIRQFSVRPGMTGLSQVSGQKFTGLGDWVLMDNCYIDSRSLVLDLKIMALTLGVLIRRVGAI